MTKRPCIPILLLLSGSAALLATVAFAVVVLTIGDAARTSDKARACGLLTLDPAGQTTPAYQQYQTGEGRKWGGLVWYFRDELARDELALEQLKVATRRCDVGYQIQ